MNLIKNLKEFKQFAESENFDIAMEYHFGVPVFKSIVTAAAWLTWNHLNDVGNFPDSETIYN